MPSYPLDNKDQNTRVNISSNQFTIQQVLQNVRRNLNYVISGAVTTRNKKKNMSMTSDCLRIQIGRNLSDKTNSLYTGDWSM